VDKGNKKENKQKNRHNICPHELNSIGRDIAFYMQELRIRF
jgi:hypothetical protein